MKILFSGIIIALIAAFSLSASNPSKPVRALIITGGHGYKVAEFNKMLESLAPDIAFMVEELPGAFEMFLPENREKYDVLIFYHMWQKITDEQAKILSECIETGKPLVALHHSICAFDNWPEYWNIIGGKYFHKETSLKGKVFQPGSYIHDLKFEVKIVDPEHPVTRGMSNFHVFDETYKGYYVEDGVTPLLTTEEPSSNQVIGWTKRYGKSKIVVLQSGHDSPTYENPDYRKLLKQAIEWVIE